MRRNRLFLLLALLLVGILLLAGLPFALRQLPTRYAMRLPAPLQAMALPEETNPLLPTAAAPQAAADLLAGAGAPPVITTTTSPPSPTPLPAVEAVVTEAVVTEAVVTEPATIQPSPTAPPATPTATPWPIPAATRLTGFTHVFQEWNNCGPATMVMALTYFGRVHSQRDTATVLRPNPEDRNVTPQEMAAFVNTQDGLRAVARLNGDLDLLKRLLANEIPVIIEIGFDPPGEYQWLGWYGHYLLPVAYDDTAQQIWVYDSWLGTSEVPQTNADPNGRVLTYDELESYWSQFNRSYIALYTPEQEALVAELLGTALDDDAMWRAALARAQADAARDPNNAFYWFNLGSSYNALGQHDDAAVAFDQARAIGLPWRMLWYQFGPYEAYYQTGRYEDVRLLAETTLQDRPYFEESYYYLGLAQAALGDQTAARGNLERASAFNPNFVLAAQALAELTANGQ